MGTVNTAPIVMGTYYKTNEESFPSSQANRHKSFCKKIGTASFSQTRENFSMPS